MGSKDETLQALRDLPAALHAAQWGDDSDEEPVARVEIDAESGRLALSFHAASPGDADRFFELVRGIAAEVTALSLTTEDEGVNGTCAWDLHPLLAEDAHYPKLVSLQLEGNKPGDHSRKIVVDADDYEENGVLGRLLDRAPQLTTLVAPSGPASAFFERDRHPLKSLTIHAGYDHQGFIDALAKSRCFPQLASLQFLDYSETYMDDWEKQLTPAAAYQALFTNVEGLPALRRVTLVNANNADEAKLRALPLAKRLEVFESTRVDS